MTSRAIALSLRKEARALVPLWTGCMLALALLALNLDNHLLLPFGVMIYGLGSIGLGAHAMGHEYGHRTVSLLLSHPVDRRALVLVKFVVLVPMLATLGLLAFSTVVPALHASGTPIIPTSTGWLIFFSSVTLAPALTMLGRSGIAGMVFTTGVASAVGIVSEVFVFGRLWFWMLMTCTLGAFAGWRLYSRLEANEGRGRGLYLPALTRPAREEARATAPRHPLARLIAKELRLQQMTFAISAASVLGIVVDIIRRGVDPDALSIVAPLVFIYIGAMPILIGSLASAEERQLGTLEWQQLMPMRASAQFAVKAGVAIALALALALGAPAVTLWVLGADVGLSDWSYLALAIVATTCACLYVSSLNSSGVRALLISMPSLVIFWMATFWVRRFLWSGLSVLFARFQWGRPFGMFGVDGPAEALIVKTAIGVGFGALLLFFAHRNHRSAERPSTHLKRQAGWIVSAVVAAVSLMILTGIR